MAASKSFRSLLTTEQGIAPGPPKVVMASGVRVKIRMDAMFFPQATIGGMPSHYEGFVLPLNSNEHHGHLLACRWEARLYTPWTHLRVRLLPLDRKFSTEKFTATVEFDIIAIRARSLKPVWNIQHQVAKFYVAMLPLIQSIKPNAGSLQSHGS
jgi:hypothetical protein